MNQTCPGTCIWKNAASTNGNHGKNSLIRVIQSEYDIIERTWCLLWLMLQTTIEDRTD